MNDMNDLASLGAVCAGSAPTPKALRSELDRPLEPIATTKLAGFAMVHP